MKVKELIGHLEDCDEDAEVLMWDSSTGEDIRIDGTCFGDEGSERLAFEIDCKKDPQQAGKNKVLQSVINYELGIAINARRCLDVLTVEAVCDHNVSSLQVISSLTKHL